MSTIRVTKEFKFEMAHALYGYDGPCRNIHGHSYLLTVTVIGKVNSGKNNPKNGMVVDFSDIKALVNKEIVHPLDHALLLNGNSPHKQFARKNTIFEKIILTPYQPTCENMILDFVGRIKPRLPKGLKLHHLVLRETSTSFAEWYAEDN
jgi:6-pyruvoyltetrahydropterin/6-carboxytetrahydropterin synthase